MPILNMSKTLITLKFLKEAIMALVAKTAQRTAKAPCGFGFLFA
ncbi:hypothetical protein SSYM_1916 [Serratia symbiotica str. Tucson]|uniref:Uncharacterized protein n=1 Tax=Serratia symbiotica str. Tucson TaxID=914128 RepID=E9CNC8_9GAMM|nr:hypothetical protein SSYM_1916 [Serratia symbiotica str. Tucson]